MLERDAITRALAETKGNIGKAAKLLGASRRTLQNRMREYGMARGKSGKPKRRLPYARRRKTWAVGAVAAAAVAGVVLIKRGQSA